MKMMTAEQIAEAKSEMVKEGVPVRFQEDGCTVNILTGQKQKRGINIIHQTAYWNFTRETAKKIADWTGTNPVFSE